MVVVVVVVVVPDWVVVAAVVVAVVEVPVQGLDLMTVAIADLADSHYRDIVEEVAVVDILVDLVVLDTNFDQVVVHLVVDHSLDLDQD